MKNLFYALFILPSVLFGQGNQTDKRIQVDLGLIIHRTNLNEDNYIDNKSPAGLDEDRILAGLDLRFSMPSNWENVDFIFGALIERNGDEYSNTPTDRVMNGGGVYAGISPRTKGKNFGVTSMFAIGVLSYKDYYSYYSDNPPPVIDIYEKKASFGLGAMSSVGLYLRAGPVGINPQVNAVFSGGHEASFLFYGVVLPLTVQF